MKKYIVDERTLLYLLYCEMEVDMLERDGVDNWIWYGEGRHETKAAFYPGNWDELIEDDQMDTSFEDIAAMRLEAGEFQELIEFEV